VTDVLVQLLPLAVVIAVNPLPIIAIVLIMQVGRGRLMGSAFVGAWIVALLALGGAAIAIANQTDLYGSGSASPVARVIRGAVGVMLVVLAARKWTGRPRSGDDAKTPAGWMTVHPSTPAKSARLGALLAAGNPKNIAVTLAAAAAVAEAGLPVGREVVALSAFVLLSTAGVATPLVATLVLGPRGDQVLAGWGRWLARHNATVMAVVLLVIGLLLVAGALTG
jgi:hypothetical protein